MSNKLDGTPVLSPEENRQIERSAALLRLVADGKRLKMLYLLRQGELCVCKIMEVLDISQALASHHLGVLREAGLVYDRRVAPWVYYSLNAQAFGELEHLLGQLARPTPMARAAGAMTCESPAGRSHP